MSRDDEKDGSKMSESLKNGHGMVATFQTVSFRNWWKILKWVLIALFIAQTITIVSPIIAGNTGATESTTALYSLARWGFVISFVTTWLLYVFALLCALMLLINGRSNTEFKFSSVDELSEFIAAAIASVNDEDKEIKDDEAEAASR